MKIVLVGAAVLAFAGGASLKELNVSQPERDVLSGRVIYSTICIRCHGVDGKGDGELKFTPRSPTSRPWRFKGSWMRGYLRACMTASRIRRWEPGGNYFQTTRFGMRLPMFGRWLPNKMTAWAAGFDEIDALPDHVGLWIVTIAVAGWFFVQGWTTEGTDGRMAIVLAPVERDLILGEMRMLLKAVHGVVTGLAGQDRRQVELRSNRRPVRLEWAWLRT